MVKKAEKITREARLACEKWRTYFKQNVDQYHEMHTFVLGQQWDEDETGEMIRTFRKVPLTANHLGAMSNSLLGEQQQNTPQLQVVPLSQCSEEVASIRENIVKDLIISPKSSVVYQVAASQAFIGGFGAFAWGTEYTHADSFELNIVPNYFKDATRCYWDVGAEDINKTDGMHCGYASFMTRSKFREIYGKHVEERIMTEAGIFASKEEVALAVQPDVEMTGFSWATDECITILDHYVRVPYRETIYKLSNGKTYNQEELDELIEKSQEFNLALQQQQVMGEMAGVDMAAGEEAAADNMALEAGEDEGLEEPMIEEDIITLWDNGMPIRIEDKKTVKRFKIKHYQLAGDYILDESEFPSEQLPVIFVDNNSYYDKHGKQMCRSFFGDARDTQKYINYLRTQSAYILKISRYDQFIGSRKNVQGLDTQRDWRDPSTVQGLLAYDESPQGIKPEQLRPPELSQSLVTQYQLAVEDLYMTTGLYPTRMGNQGNEVSGAAIDARTRQGSYSTYVAFNSLNRAIAKGGEIVNEMIPAVYDSERVITLMTPQDGLKTFVVNRQVDEYGEQIENDIRKGTYQVRLKPGPSYEGQKQEALESLQQILQANPNIFNLVADLYADNLPLANSIELRNRLKTIVPPEIVEAGKTGKMPPPQQQGPSPEEQMIQMEQQKIQLNAEFEQEKLKLKEAELQMKRMQMENELRIEEEKLMAEKVQVAGKLQTELLKASAENERTRSDNSIAHANNLVKILTHKVT